MNDKPHVGLVDAHAEGVGGHDDLASALHEVFLRRHGARRAAARHGRRPCGGWFGRRQFRPLLRPVCGWMYRRCPSRALAEELDQHIRLLPLARRRLDFVDQVRPREPRDIRFRLVAGRLLDDVAAHPIGGRGRQRDGSRVAQQAAEIAESGIVGAKIMPPLADAMGLVDRQQAGAAPPGPRRGTAHCETARHT